MLFYYTAPSFTSFYGSTVLSATKFKRQKEVNEQKSTLVQGVWYEFLKRIYISRMTSLLVVLASIHICVSLLTIVKRHFAPICMWS